MKKTSIEDDILQTGLLLNEKYSPKYNKVYYSTNEDLNALLEVFDVKDKSILSVVGSGDQAFHFYSKNAKNIDLFDINKITIHYYYLRVWIIKYLGDYYPNKDFASYIEYLLEMVKPITEQENESLLYWKKFIRYFPKNSIIKLFKHKSLTDEKTHSMDMDILDKRLSAGNPVFYNIDISEKINKKIDNKYDVIYVSNIRDWIISKSNLWHFYCENLYNLLNDNGVVLSSNVISNGPWGEEIGSFEKNFDYKILSGNATHSILEFESPGYIYTKKKQ